MDPVRLTSRECEVLARWGREYRFRFVARGIFLVGVLVALVCGFSGLKVASDARRIGAEWAQPFALYVVSFGCFEQVVVYLLALAWEHLEARRYRMVRRLADTLRALGRLEGDLFP